MTEWKECKLSNLADVTSSKRIFYSDYVETGVPFWRSKEVIEQYNRKKVSTELFITEQKYEEISSKFGVPNAGDILLTSVGTLGIPYLVKLGDRFYFKDGNLTWIRNIDRKRLLPKYMYLWLGSNIGRSALGEITIGSTQEALTICGLKGLTVSLPPLPEQRAIAAVLSSLDDKIDLLNRQNKTLEAMAETLFKQWFVEEADAGWEEGKLSDIVSIKYGKDHKNLMDGTIPAYGSGGIMRYVDTALFTKESVLIPRKGTLNNVIYIDEPFWTVDTMFYTEMKIENAAKFVFHLINSKDLASMNVGSAVPSMTTELLNNMSISIPDSKTLCKFEATTAPFFLKLKSNRKQIGILEKLRDKLLPKLMSGEIRIQN